MKFFLFIFLIIIVPACKVVKSQFLDLQSYEKENVTYGYENENYDSSLLIKRLDSDLIILSLFEEFDDTVVLYLNKKEAKEWYITKINNPSTSSGYSGEDIGIVLDKNTSNIIYIKLLNQKKYVSIILDKSYPLCTLQRYEKIWYVNFRRKKMILQ